MPAIITKDLKLRNSNNFSESFTEVSRDNLYVALGRQQSWTNESIPETPLDTPKYRLGLYDDFIGIKKLQFADVVPVVPRINWTTGVVYTQYDDEKEVVGGVNPNTGKSYSFYVMTNDYNVYKCISNNNGVASTVQPSGTNVTDVITLPDGYVWKYMYTVSTYDSINYLSVDWLPVRTLKTDNGSNQWNVQQNAVDGSIYNIIVTDIGSGYAQGDIPTVVITGDGTGASGTANVDVNGNITSITVTNPGSGYTYATVTIDDTGVTHTGNDALARAVISPIGGHGSNAESELGASHRMIKIEFNGDEGGNLPLGVDYRQITLLMNPKITTQGKYLSLSNVNGIFAAGDVITESGGAQGTVVEFNYYDNELIVLPTSGTFGNTNTVDNGNGSTATIASIRTDNVPATATFIQPAELIKGSGEIIYINNRTKITRFTEQDERIRLVVTF